MRSRSAASGRSPAPPRWSTGARARAQSAGSTRPPQVGLWARDLQPAVERGASRQTRRRVDQHHLLLLAGVNSKYHQMPLSSVIRRAKSRSLSRCTQYSPRQACGRREPPCARRPRRALQHSRRISSAVFSWKIRGVDPLRRGPQRRHQNAPSARSPRARPLDARTTPWTGAPGPGMVPLTTSRAARRGRRGRSSLQKVDGGVLVENRPPPRGPRAASTCHAPRPTTRNWALHLLQRLRHGLRSSDDDDDRRRHLVCRPSPRS